MTKKIFTVVALLNLMFSIEMVSAKAKTLYEKIQDQAILDNIKSQYVTGSTGIDFSKSSSDTNGKGVYTIANTKNNKYPIHYYRGDVNNNWVIYAGYCWNIVRTTETGGVKILYSGLANPDGTCEINFEEELSISDIDANYMYNDIGNIDNDKLDSHGYDSLSWIDYAEKSKSRRSMANTNNYYYSDNVSYNNGQYTLVDPKQYQWKSGNNYEDTNLNDELIGKYTCVSSNDSGCSSVYFIVTADGYLNSMYYVRMDDGETYESIIQNLKNDSQYKLKLGTDVVFQNGKYQLQNIMEVSMLDLYKRSVYYEIANKYKYTCMNDSNECETIKYFYNIDSYEDYSTNFGTEDYYTIFKTIDLSNGQKIEDILNNYFTNNTESEHKKIIDKWYENNLKLYDKYLEDTIWCNDRSIVPMEKGISGYSNADYEKYMDNLSPATYYRLTSGNQSLSCINKNDAFTVDNKIGNGKLKYPVGMLTLDEALYAGGTYNEDESEMNYLYYGLDKQEYIAPDFLLMSPYSINIDGDASPMVVREGQVGGPISYCPVSLDTCSSHIIRPMVSLKNGTVCVGEGTAEDPCVVKKIEEEPVPTPNTGDNASKYMVLLVISSLMLLFMLKHKLMHNN